MTVFLSEKFFVNAVFRIYLYMFSFLLFETIFVAEIIHLPPPVQAMQTHFSYFDSPV